jgi:acetyl-CoA carboxylase biotin carboxyl carrier protein
MGDPRSESTWLTAVRRIVAAARTTDVEEVELTHGEFSVRVRRNVSAHVTMVAPGASAAGGIDPSHGAVVAPLTGIFYRSPSPNAPPYVNVGDFVEADTVIGLIETMKIFNEVTADQEGRIVAFRAEAAQLVHAGETLVSIEPGKAPASAGETA